AARITHAVGTPRIGSRATAARGQTSATSTIATSVAPQVRLTATSRIESKKVSLRATRIARPRRGGRGGVAIRPPAAAGRPLTGAPSASRDAIASALDATGRDPLDEVALEE